jgi:hypothetical protein
MINRKKTAAAAKFIEAASAYIDYTSGPMLDNRFGATVGYNNQPWSGSFIDVVGRESGLDLPSFAYTPTAISEAARLGLIRSQPMPGDIVVFNFASENAGTAFSQPHVGVVTDVREWKLTGRFLTIEGNVRPGTRNNQDRDGVFPRLRNRVDVMVFIRPTLPAQRPGKLLTKVLKMVFSRAARIDAASLEEAARANNVLVLAALKPGNRNRQIEVVQLALGVTVGLQGCKRGEWDSLTASAFAAYQRRIGFVGAAADGYPTAGALRRLGTDTGIFSLTE